MSEPWGIMSLSIFGNICIFKCCSQLFNIIFLGNIVFIDYAILINHVSKHCEDFSQPNLIRKFSLWISYWIANFKRVCLGARFMITKEISGQRKVIRAKTVLLR